MRLWWKDRPPPPPPPDAWSLGALILDATELDELIATGASAIGQLAPATLRPWLEASFVCLLAFATVHMAVRGISRMGFGQQSHSLLIRLAWASVFAIFPEAPNPVRLRSAWHSTVGKAIERTRSAAKVPLGKSTPTPRARRESRARVAVGRLSKIGEHVLLETQRHVQEEGGYLLGVMVMELAVAFVAPVAFCVAGPALLPFRIHGKVLLSGLMAARVVSPLGQGLKETCDKIIDESGYLESGAADARQVVSMVPSMVQGTLWVVWGAALASALGLDVSAMWSSLGWSGVLFGLAMQHYAADIVGGFTLLADGRFVLGDMISLGKAPGWTVIVRQVGLLQTRCQRLDDGFGCSIPNSMLVQSPIYNWARIQSRRVPLGITVDGSLTAAQLAPLPRALLDAAKRAAREAGFVDISFNGDELGEAAEITELNGKQGISMELVYFVPDVPSDRGRWKRVRSAILLGMMRELEGRGVALGRPWKRTTMVVHEDQANMAAVAPGGSFARLPGVRQPSIDRVLQNQVLSLNAANPQ